MPDSLYPSSLLGRPFAALALCAALAAPAALAETPLFDALGGREGVSHIADELVSAVLADARIAASFEGADLPRLRKMLAEQFCELAGGPCKYSGKSMQLIHEDLKITQAHFNALAEDLQLVLERRGVAAADSNRLVAKLAPMFRQIVTR